MRIAHLFPLALVVPILAHAEPQCALQAPSAAAAASADLATGEAGDPDATSRARSVPTSGLSHEPLLAGAPAPVLGHVVAAGAQLTDAGASHGLRAVVARNDGQFMRLYVAPDGQVLIAGLMSDLTVEDLITMAAGKVTELGSFHGMRGIFVANGKQFQVFYATPDSQRVIPGAMFDAQGRNLTRDHVASIPGAIPTVVIGDAMPLTSPASRDDAASPLKAAEATTYGTVGPSDAPRLWVFIDPLCSWSVRAMEQLRPYVASGRLQLAVVPISVLDHEDGGRSTVLAKAMLSLPPDTMVAAWGGNRLANTAEPAADARLSANQAAASAIGLRGTPTILWRKVDGTEGRADGLPGNLDALVASMGGRP